MRLNQLLWLSVVAALAGADAAAATLWRKVPMTPYEERYRLHSLNAKDVTVGIDGSIYMANGLLQRYDAGEWVSVDSLPKGLALNEGTGGYVIAVKDPKSRSRLKADGLVRMMHPDRINGIAERVAIDDRNHFWVVTTRGRVFGGGRDAWARAPVMASDVIAGPNGQAAVWTRRTAHRQHKGEHDRWLAQNPHPKLYRDGRWQDVTGLPGTPNGMAFDGAGNLWALIYQGDTASGTGLIFRREGSSWQQQASVANGRFIESDLKGNLWVLSYRKDKPEGENTWSHDEGRIHWWRDGVWFDDPAIPDLTVMPGFSTTHGTLLQFENKLTFAHNTRWLSLTEVSDAEYDRVMALKQPQEPRPMPWDEEEEEEEPDLAAVLGRAPGPAPEVSSAGPSIAGCWLWSNGVTVLIHDDGFVQAGFLQNQWQAGAGKNAYTIEWPPIRDTWTLSDGGTRFHSLSSLNVQLTGHRISGEAGSVAGVWQRSDGAVLTLAADGTISAGPFHGTWTAQNATTAVLDWPLLDEITVAQSGQTLAMRNQFAQSSAQRIACQ